MLKVTAQLRSASPLCYGKVVQEPKLKNENHDSYDKRVWQLKSHHDDDGLYIPANAIKNMLYNTAKFLSETVPGRGKATFTKNFEVGIMAYDKVLLNKSLDDLEQLVLHVPADGKKGGTTRVWKTFPIVKEWSAACTFYVVDQLLIDNIAKVEDYLNFGGKFIGLLTFRPRQGGEYGRFEVTKFNYELTR